MLRCRVYGRWADLMTQFSMHIYNWENRELTRGVEVSISSRGNTFVPLGDPDTPGPAHMVTLHDRNPAEVSSGKLYSVFPFWVRPKDAPNFLVFAAPHDHLKDVDTVLIRVSTWSPTVYSGRGYWRAQDSETQTMLTGIKHYTSDNGRKACASYGLVRLCPQQTLRIRPEGADDQWAVSHTGREIRSEPWDVHRARQIDALYDADALHPGDILEL